MLSKVLDTQFQGSNNLSILPLQHLEEMKNVKRSIYKFKKDLTQIPYVQIKKMILNYQFVMNSMKI